MRLSGNKILITGGNKGIGLALAKAFLDLDNQVIITGRNMADLENVQQEFPEIFTFQCDLASKPELESLVMYIQNEHSDINILVNNAGLQYNYSFLEEPQLIQKIEYELKVNLEAPMILFAHLLPFLQLNENAALINVSSALGIVPKSSAAVYCASKAAIHNWTESIRSQMKELSVFEIIPPLVDTGMTQGRGTNKISPDTLAKEFLIAFEKNNFQVKTGKVKILSLLHRFLPALASRIINKGA